MKIKLLTIVAVCILSGCGSDVYSVDELVEDQELYKEIKAKCHKGELDKSHQNCVNYDQAARIKQSQSGFSIEY